MFGGMPKCLFVNVFETPVQKECLGETQCKYLLFTKYLTSTNMPTAQEKKGYNKKKVLVPDKRGSTVYHFDCTIS